MRLSKAVLKPPLALTRGALGRIGRQLLGKTRFSPTKMLRIWWAKWLAFDWRLVGVWLANDGQKIGGVPRSACQSF
jgi:hypothetical protein